MYTTALHFEIENSNAFELQAYMYNKSSYALWKQNMLPGVSGCVYASKSKMQQ
jgi:hypothetical protein